MAPVSAFWKDGPFPEPRRNVGQTCAKSAVSVIRAAPGSSPLFSTGNAVTANTLKTRSESVTALPQSPKHEIVVLFWTLTYNHSQIGSTDQRKAHSPKDP